MKAQDGAPYRLTLPLPAFVLHPLMAVGIAALHVYLAAGHLSKLLSGPVQWTDFWKGFGALAGAYVFVPTICWGYTHSATTLAGLRNDFDSRKTSNHIFRISTLFKQPSASFPVV
jgi:hypothetical protein